MTNRLLVYLVVKKVLPPGKTHPRPAVVRRPRTWPDPDPDRVAAIRATRKIRSLFPDRRPLAATISRLGAAAIPELPA